MVKVKTYQDQSPALNPTCPVLQVNPVQATEDLVL